MNFNLNYLIVLFYYLFNSCVCSSFYSSSATYSNYETPIRNQQKFQNDQLYNFRVKRQGLGFFDAARQSAREGFKIGAQAAILAGKNVNKAACQFWDAAG